MIDDNGKPYPQPMLENVNYNLFDDITPLVDLEHGTLINCEYFLEKLEAVLSDANMIQLPELIVAHLCCYLGASTAAYLMKTAHDTSPCT